MWLGSVCRHCLSLCLPTFSKFLDWLQLSLMLENRYSLCAFSKKMVYFYDKVMAALFSQPARNFNSYFMFDRLALNLIGKILPKAIVKCKF